MANTPNLDLIKPAGSDKALVSQINGNSDKIDGYAGTVNSALNALLDGLAIVANGNTHAAISSGQFVYVKNHGSLAEGLYVASTNIAANATLSNSNLTADSARGLNALNSKISTQTGSFTNDSGQQSLTAIIKKSAHSVSLRVTGTLTGITGGSGFNIGTIADGYRPATEMDVPCVLSNGAVNKFATGLVVIGANGTVTVYVPTGIDSSITNLFLGCAYITA